VRRNKTDCVGAAGRLEADRYEQVVAVPVKSAQQQGFQAHVINPSCSAAGGGRWLVEASDVTAGPLQQILRRHRIYGAIPRIRLRGHGWRPCASGLSC